MYVIFFSRLRNANQWTVHLGKFYKEKTEATEQLRYMKKLLIHPKYKFELSNSVGKCLFNSPMLWIAVAFKSWPVLRYHYWRNENNGNMCISWNYGITGKTSWFFFFTRKSSQFSFLQEKLINFSLNQSTKEKYSKNISLNKIWRVNKSHCNHIQLHHFFEYDGSKKCFLNADIFGIALYFVYS